MIWLAALVLWWCWTVRPRPDRWRRMSDEELDAYLAHAEGRDRLVATVGAMVYAAAVTQAVIEWNVRALVFGAVSLVVVWILYWRMTK